MRWAGSTARRTTAGAGAALAVLLGVGEPSAASAAAGATPTPANQCSAGSQSIAITGSTNPINVTTGHPATWVESVTSSETFDGVGLRLQLMTPSGGPEPQPSVSWSFDGGSSHGWSPQWISDPGGGEPYWMNVATPVGTVTAGRHTIAITFDPASSDPQGLFWGTVYLDSLPCDNTLGSANNQLGWANVTGYQPPSETGNGNGNGNGGSSSTTNGGASGSGSGSGSKQTSTGTSPTSAVSPSKAASAAPTRTASAPATPSSPASTSPTASPDPTVDAMAVAHDDAVPPSSGSSVPWIVSVAAAIVLAFAGTGTVLLRRRRQAARAQV